MNLLSIIPPELRYRYFIIQLAIRIVLYLVFLATERLEPAVREMTESQAWRHSYPVTKSYVSTTALWNIIYSVPPATLTPGLLLTGDWQDLRQAALAFSLGLLANGLAVNTLKSKVGRLRPDFLARCHPAGRPWFGTGCSGDARHVAEGRLSFPSGHASFCSCLAAFVCLYWSGKARLFRDESRRRWRPVLAAPPAAAALVAVSRVWDHHHHWEDVAVGYGIGVVSAIAAYGCYYPSVLGSDAGKPRPSAGDPEVAT
ncbi:phospholipid phosphatase 5-like [Pollicipes pollicipes]|uniref:phospholipid phosphatase 5-like n=1 Tax=Pollicipes pollicipes TaxID=41117 RepID=UPI0018852507|nr:phospholipid phosphatase 5-like [Pollicipes pollicipes]